MQLENDEAISTAVAILQEADVEIRYLDVEENEEGQRRWSWPMPSISG